MRTQRMISRALLVGGTLVAAGVLTLGYATSSFASSPRCESTQLTVVKTDTGGKALAGASFRLYTVTHDGKQGDATSWQGTTKLGNDGRATVVFQNVAAGKYFVVETAPPAGYSAGAAQLVTLLAETQQVTFTDTPLLGSVTVKKVDQAGAPLAGAGFTLFTSVSEPAARSAGIGTSTGKSCQITGVSGGSAQCTIADVPAASYWVEETTVPAGYTGADPLAVTVLPGQAATVTFTDTLKATPPALGSITVSKADNAGKALAGAGFTLYTDANGAPGVAVGPAPALTAVSGGIAAVTFSDVVAGTYWVEETTVPDGYVGALPKSVTVEAGQNATVSFVDEPKPLESPAGGGAVTPTSVPTVATPTSVPTVATPITGATTTHTGLPFAGSKPLVIGTSIFGVGLMAAGALLRRRVLA